MRFKTFILILSASASAQAANLDLCFTKHLFDAIQINSQRQLTYARLEDPNFTSVDSLRSIAISQAMIKSQELLLTDVAPIIDATSLLIEKDYGINISCLSFVSMDGIGDMENLPRPRNDRKMKRIEILGWQNDLKKLIYKQDLKLLEKLDLNLIKMSQTLDYPEYNCMLRHFLESTLRITKIAIANKDLMKKDTKTNELIWKMIQGHVIGFAPAYTLDRAAEPLQRDGIPIICNDVPKIP